ncbi:MAG: metallophosphoesterase [Salinivirgaceae bacterium]
MVKIGLLSDTHAYIDESITNFLESVDQIWHAGDIGNVKVLEQLQLIKPVTAVYGNIDDHLLCSELPEINSFQVEGVQILMTHIGGYPGNYAPGIKKLLLEHKPQLFVSGHSHILKVQFDKQLQCLHMNPGAAGISGFHQFRTMLRFVIDKTQIKDLEVWELPRK